MSSLSSAPEVARAFAAAARYAGDVLGDERVGAAWAQPSALELMDVGAVAGHVFLVLRRVGKRLAEAAPAEGGAPLSAWPHAVRVGQRDDLDLEIHHQVRADGSHIAAWGWEGVRVAYEERLRTVEPRLGAGRPDSVVLGGKVIAIDEYLASRVVELIVHADDLAASAGFETPGPPPEAVDVALGFLLGAARRTYGDMAVLLAFTRRERVEGWMPSVY